MGQQTVVLLPDTTATSGCSKKAIEAHNRNMAQPLGAVQKLCVCMANLLSGLLYINGKRTLCRPVVRMRSSIGPSVTLTTLLNRYARPVRPWNDFDTISSWLVRCARQLLHAYIRVPGRNERCTRPILPAFYSSARNAILLPPIHSFPGVRHSADQNIAVTTGNSVGYRERTRAPYAQRRTSSGPRIKFVL